MTYLDKAPRFCADSTQGQVKLTDYIGKWLILFSYDKDFTPVCTTELMAIAKLYKNICDMNADVLAFCKDSVPTHIAWANDISKNCGVSIQFPIVSDEDNSICNMYGVQDKSCVYIINPEQCIVATLSYPRCVGRNIPEILRIISALQSSTENSTQTPANWLPGCDMFSNSRNSYIDFMDKFRDNSTWFFDTKRLI